jgi:hypothetical protein
LLLVPPFVAWPFAAVQGFAGEHEDALAMTDRGESSRSAPIAHIADARPMLRPMLRRGRAEVDRPIGARPFARTWNISRSPRRDPSLLVSEREGTELD